VPHAMATQPAAVQNDQPTAKRPIPRSRRRTRRWRSLPRCPGAAVRSGYQPPSADRTTLIESARWLATQPAFAGTATGLLVDLNRLDNLDEIADLCASRPILAARTAERIGARLRSLREWPDTDALTNSIIELAERGDLSGGLFAVSLVHHGASFGWKTPWRDLLIRLRQHSDLDVREEAYAIDMT
jgi:hypothetical protein